MKWTLFFFITLSLLSHGCKSGEEELASFEGGKIQRKDLREFYAFRDIPNNENTTSIKTQSSIVENLVVQTLVEKEVVKKNLHETPVFKKAMELSEIQLISNLHRKEYIERFKSKEKLEIANIQFMMVTGAEAPEKHLEKLNSLKSDKEIFAYVSENTAEEQRKPLGGLFEPVCMNCQDDTFLPVFQEGLNANDKNFRITKFGGDKIFIYRVIDKKSISASDIEKSLVKRFSTFRDLALEFQNNASTDKEKELAKYYAEDEPALSNKGRMFAQRILQNFEQKAWNDEYERIQTELQFKPTEIIQSNTTDFSKLNSDTVLFQTKDIVYKLEDLTKELKDLQALRGKEESNQNADLMNYLQNISIPKFLLVNTEEGEKVKKSEKYITQLTLLKKNVAWNIYLKEVQDKMVISEEEIKNTYEMGKNFAYSEEVPGQAGKKRPMPFASVKDRIKEELQNNKLKSTVDEMIKKLKEDYKVIFFTEKLKAGEV